ncbi:hypothetical protein HYX12_03965 [Candidatus Woesearchaeota archaeon]|nr:hypothetical protein [Candidatus Woesearchaeota archaeon]
MVKKGNSKVTLSLNGIIYNSFREYCEEKAILLSKKVELWMEQEAHGSSVYPRGLYKPTLKSKNKKVTLSIDQSVYHSFQNYCELHAIMLSRKVEIWMSTEMENNNGKK